MIFFITILFPIFILIRILSNFILFRFGRISRRIGHFANDVNLYLCEFKKEQKFQFDFFYTEKPVCNYALLNIYKQYLNVLPELIILPFILINKIKIIGNLKHNIILHPYPESNDLRDRFENENKVKYFNERDIERGYSFLKKIGLNKNDKYVCILCRDEEYVKSLFSKTYDLDYRTNGDVSRFRNCNIDDFKLATDIL